MSAALATQGYECDGVGNSASLATFGFDCLEAEAERVTVKITGSIEEVQRINGRIEILPTLTGAVELL